MRITTFLFLAACASPLCGQTPDSTHHDRARLIGVYNSQTGDPLAGVQVLDVYSGTYATTTVTGSALLTYVTFRGSAGFVELRKLGYEPKQILVSRDDSSAITEVLDPIATLAPVVVNENYRIDADPGQWLGFETRCQSKVVGCIRTEDLEKHPLNNIADLLIRTDGVQIGSCGRVERQLGKAVNTSTFCGQVVMEAVGPGVCRPTFFVDGNAWDATLGPPIDLFPGRSSTAPYTVSSVKGIEVYATGRPRPLRFQSSTPNCGAIVIWTK